MSKKGFLEILPDGEVHRRRRALREMHISDVAICKMELMSPQLCSAEAARARMKNLCELGFEDPLVIVEAQPHVLLRSEHDVTSRIKMWQTWCKKIGARACVLELCKKRTQIFTAMVEKVHVVFLVAQHLAETEVGRICNMVTLNIESVLHAFAWGQQTSFVSLHEYARKNKVAARHDLMRDRLLIVQAARTKLPQDVYDAYTTMMYKKYPSHKEMISSIMR